MFEGLHVFVRFNIREIAKKLTGHQILKLYSLSSFNYKVMCQTFNETTRHFLIAGTVGSDDDILVVNMENAYIP